MKTKSLNTGIVTFKQYNKTAIKKVSQITFTHETGHSFGSPHDSPSRSNCVPGGREGNYIMFAGATSANLKNNRLFSPCSRESINDVMDVKGRCIADRCCFRDGEGAICGNKVVDEGEECDCGYIGDNSCRMDVCCIGRNANSGCKLRPGKICRFISIHCSLCLFFCNIYGSVHEEEQEARKACCYCILLQGQECFTEN